MYLYFRQSISRSKSQNRFGRKDVIYSVNNQPETIFQALTDSTRIRIIRLMATAGDEACLCEFVDSLLEPEYKISRHVKVLKSSGFLRARKDGRWVYHSLVSGTPYLDALYESIRLLPDTDGAFKKDLGNFRKRLKLREDGRCQIGIQSKEFLEKAKS